MNPVNHEIGHDGIRFFGKVSASISHEINNALAVMNENAGLIEDFCLMNVQGKPLDPDRIAGIAKNLLQQITRAHDIVKLLNRFAHSADEPVRRIDMGELIDLVLGVSARPATLRGVRLVLEQAQAAAIVSNPFALENLICRSIEYALRHVGPGKEIRIAFSRTADGAAVQLSGIQGLTDADSGMFPMEAESRLMDTLGVNIQIHPPSGEILLEIPERMPGAEESGIIDSST